MVSQNNGLFYTINFGNILEVMRCNLCNFNIYYCSNKERNLSKKGFLQLNNCEIGFIEVNQYCWLCLLL